MQLYAYIIYLLSTYHAELAGKFWVGDDLVRHAVALGVQRHWHLPLCRVLGVWGGG